MNVQTVRTIARIRELSQADVARAANVSRQAVSKWFQKEPRIVHMRSPHLKALAQHLKLPSDILLNDLPGLSPQDRASLETQLLWDRLYPDLDSFLLAITKHEPRAVGRMVEAFGLYTSAKIVGVAIWKTYPSYARFIHPTRRAGLEKVWLWRNSRT